MKCEEAINGPDRKLWEEEIKNESNQMVKFLTWEVVEWFKLPPHTKPIDSTRACKKKSDRKLRGHLNGRGFKQAEGVHNNEKSPFIGDKCGHHLYCFGTYAIGNMAWTHF